MKSRAREQASSSIPLRGRHERGAEKNGKQMRSQVASRSENHDGKQQDMTTHEQNAKSDRQTRPEPAHNSHKSKTNDTPRPPRVRPRGQERERKKWSIWYYVVQFSSDPGDMSSLGLKRWGSLVHLNTKLAFPHSPLKCNSRRDIRNPARRCTEVLMAPLAGFGSPL